MSLSNELVSQFVKVTKDQVEEKKETTVYGTIVKKNDAFFVQLDGSDLLTPISSTADVLDGERVTVMIKNHTATVTGNLSSPSARTDSVRELGNTVTEFEIVLADKVSTVQFDAEVARINNLSADNVTIKERLNANEADIKVLVAEDVTINEKLTAAEASISDLSTTKLDASIADITYATITELNATDASVHNLEATYGEFSQLTTEKLDAHEADIKSLETDKLSVADADIKYATITELDSTNADIENLQSDVANIDTLIFGSATGNVIHTSFANAVIAQLGNAQIKSAMIENISASQISAGDINTNNVRVLSEDGKLLISDETIQISDDRRVRVQIGKDASNDYSINIWDADGNLMFSQGGITDSAIKSAIIRNDMVSADANISASKLDISSLFTEINNSTETIKSTKIYLDDKAQTLDVAFTAMSSEIDDLSDDVSSQGTQISVIQGQIESKVWQQDIDSATDEFGNRIDTLETQQTSLTQTVDGLSSTVSNHSSQIATANDNAEEAKASADAAQADVDALAVRVTTAETKITQNSEQIALMATKDEVTQTLGGYYTKEETDAAITVKANEIDLSVDSKIAGIELGGRNLLTHRSSYGVVTNGTYSHRSMYLHDFSNLVEGMEYTISFDGELPNDCTTWYLNVYSYDETDTQQYPPFITEFKIENGRWVGTGVCPSGRITLINLYPMPLATAHDGEATTSRVKLERGNKATDWTPAPEDMATAEDLSNYYTKTETEARLTVESDNISTRVTESIKVGGRNLALNSGNEISNNNYCAASYNISPSEGSILESGYGHLVVDETYTMVLDVTPAENVTYYAAFMSNGNISRWYFNTDGTTNRQTISVTNVAAYADGKTPEDDVRNAVIDIYRFPNDGTVTGESIIHSFMVVKGTKAAIGWTPAPEDVDEDMSDVNETANEAQNTANIASERVIIAESEIQQLVDSIIALVRDGNGGSLIRQDTNGLWYFDISGIENNINSNASNLDELSGIVRDANGEIDVLKSTAAALQERTEYVRSYTDENDQPCLELGEGDSVFKVRITNTEIQLAEGSDIPTRINRKMLIIEKAMVRNELQFGDDEQVADGVWIWKRRVNGNLGLLWKGVEN